MEYVCIEQGGVASAKDFLAAGITAGLKLSGAPDMALIYSRRPCVAAGAFTSNLFAAAPVIYDRGIIAGGQPVRAVLVNSGNANACTGERGLRDVRPPSHSWRLLQIPERQVLLSSASRIGVPMPMDVIKAGAARQWTR